MEDTLAGTNGLAVDGKGNLVGARQLDGSLSYIDWQTKQVTPIVTSYQGKRFNSPNDLTIADDDTIYFTGPHRIWSLAALHGIPGRRGYSGGEWLRPWGSSLLLFYFFRRDQKNIFEGNAITFLIPRTTSRFFFAILTTHRRIYFSALEGLFWKNISSCESSVSFIHGRWSPGGPTFTSVCGSITNKLRMSNW